MTDILSMINYSLINLGISAKFVDGLSIFITICCIGIISWLANYIAKRYLVKLIRFVISKVDHIWGEKLVDYKVFNRLSYLAPALIIYYSVPLFVNTTVPLTASLVDMLRAISIIFVILVLTFTISAFLSTLAEVYKNFKITRNHPIKSYVQITKIILFVITGILCISIVLDKSPTALLTGLGAMTAVLMLIFKDSILGFVASIQNATYDMVRIGDWIEMPKYGADGDVIDMSLNSMKVQNFDKTIVTIPTHAILNEGIKNWRGMNEAGGRRIKRAVYIDINTIKFCNETMLQRYRHIQYMPSYIDQKLQEIATYNKESADKSAPANRRNLTNVGLFRAYLEQYLKHHPKVHQDLTFLIRQLQPAEKGLPIEIYIFTNDTNWNNYEAIQADIFDHILAIIPEFDLKVFQNISNQNVSISLDQAREHEMA